MRWISMTLVIVSVALLAEIVDPSFGSMEYLSDGWKSIGWNPAGLVEIEKNSIYVDVVYRTSSNRDIKGFNAVYISGRNESNLAGAVGIYRFFSIDFESLGTYYEVSGVSEINWGVGLGLEKVKDEVNPNGYYSVFLDLGILGKIDVFEYSFSLRKLRLWSERFSSYLIGDFGIGFGLDFKTFEIGLNLSSYEAEIFKVHGGVEVEFPFVGMSLGGGMILDGSDMEYTLRVDGSIYFSGTDFSIGVYLAQNLSDIDVPDQYWEVELPTVISSFFILRM